MRSANVIAMYETHGQAALPSTRFRDLVDLMIIIDRRIGAELAANAVTAGMTTEQSRRGIIIPTDLPVPGPQWVSGYNRLATPLLPRDLNRLNGALTLLRPFVVPILAGTADGRWDPASRHWR